MMSQKSDNSKPSVIAVLVAAGVGRRMQCDVPKQYLPLKGKPVLQHSAERLLKLEDLEHLVIVVSSDDPFYAELDIARHEKVSFVEGGETRFDSVKNATTFLYDYGYNLDTALLIHDAARPCVRTGDINELLSYYLKTGQPAILAAPIDDTVKQVNFDEQVELTLDRQFLRRALTPQVAPLGMLKKAYDDFSGDKGQITDDASLLESQGITVTCIEGARDNIKITRPGDLDLASLILDLQEQA